MTDEMILVPRDELLAWAEEWLYENDPGDGTDCITPFDTYLLKSPVVVQTAAVDGLNVWRDAFIAERATRYRESGMSIESSRVHAETDATLIAAQQGGEVHELRLCESSRLFLRPDRLYRFTVDPDCSMCREAASYYAQPGGSDNDR